MRWRDTSKDVWSAALVLVSEDVCRAHLGPIVFLVLMGIRRSPFLGWVALIILVSHSVFAHKEIRYLYPLCPLKSRSPRSALWKSLPAFNTRRKSPLSSRTIVAGGLAFCVLSSCVLASHFDWSRSSGSFAAFDQLSRDSTLCGVGVYRMGWAHGGGYTHLHKNVPIVVLYRVSELEQEWRSFNALITYGSLTDPKDGFELAGCWDGTCLYRRPGPCTPPQGDIELNRMLRLTGH